MSRLLSARDKDREAQLATTDIREVIDGALREWENAFNSGDTAALAALYTENATLMPPDSDAVHGRP
jgi:ketosteroid isomerase-like protein